MSSYAEQVRIDQDIEGMNFRALERLIQLYTDKSHFIYELLQNAEDASANVIRFIQYDDRLEVMHDGKPFTLSNLKGLCDIGKSDKVDNLNQIGEFGVGFKSVYGICKTVKLFSDPSHYKRETYENIDSISVEIQKFTCPVDIPDEPIPSKFTTRFIFPYTVGQSFSSFSSIESLNKTLSKRLQNLGISALLFMKNLSSIEYEIDTEMLKGNGFYTLIKEKLSPHCTRVSASGETTNMGENTSESVSYLLFTRRLNKSTRSVDIAYPVVMKGNGTYECVRTKDPYISVYFPTRTESKLDFIVQGPFRTTPDRASIPEDNPENIELVDETAKLLRSSLLDLKEMGIFNLSFIQILPIDPDKFDYYGLFYPLFDAVKEAFQTSKLLPCEYGDYTSSGCAKIGYNEEMLQLFDDEKLSILINDKRKYHWLASCLTESSDEYRTVYYFLTNELEVDVIDPEELCIFISHNERFLPKQDESWLIRLYSLFESYSCTVYSSDILTSPIIKSTEGEFVAPYKHTGIFDQNLVENAFIKPQKSELKGIIFVDVSLYNQCQNFFDNILKLEEPDEYEIMMPRIQQHFSHHDKECYFSESQHIEDIKFLIRYAKIYPIDHSPYANPRSKEIWKIIKASVLLRCLDGTYCHPSEIYVPESEDGFNIQIYLKNIIKDAKFLDTDFYTSHDISFEDLGLLGVHITLLLNEDETSGECLIDGGSVSQTKGDPARWTTKGSFRWMLSLDHIEDVLQYISNHADADDSPQKSKIIMDFLFNNEEMLRGRVLLSGEMSNLEKEPCHLIRQLREDMNISNWNGKWLYNQFCDLVEPQFITCHELNTDIYGQIKKRTIVYELLQFKKSDEDAVEEISKTMTEAQKEALFEKMLMQHFGLSSQDISDRLGHSTKFDTNKYPAGYDYPEEEFPVGKVKDWQAIKKHAAEMLLYADPVHYEQRIRSIRTSNRKAENRAYLKNMYGLSKKNLYACQLCHRPSPDIEATELFNEPDLELDPLNLCLCPNCNAKYKKIRFQDTTMRHLRNEILNYGRDKMAYGNQVIIPVNDEELWFTQIHFAEIQELIKLQIDIQADSKRQTMDNHTNNNVFSSSSIPAQNKTQKNIYNDVKSNRKPSFNAQDEGWRTDFRNNTKARDHTIKSTRNDSDRVEENTYERVNIQNDFSSYTWLIGKTILRQEDGFEGTIISIKEGQEVPLLEVKKLKGQMKDPKIFIKVDKFLEQKDEGIYIILD